MNFGDVLRVGAFCLSTVGMFNNISAMNENPSEEEDYPEWPTMAVDGTPEHPEGEHLAHYHATARDRSFYYYLPKNQKELGDLYKLIGDKSESVITEKWNDILLNSDEEIISRCLDGDVFFVNKYANYLYDFIILTGEHPDKKFTQFLYNHAPGQTNLEKSLWNSVADVAGYINSSYEEYTKYTVESTHVLKFVERIDTALTKINQNTSDFFNLFCQLHIRTDYRSTPEFQAVLNEVGKMIGDMPLNL